MALAPLPTPVRSCGGRPPVLALAAVSGTALGRLGQPSTAPPAAWAAAGAAVREAARRAAAAPGRSGPRARSRAGPRPSNASGSSPTASCRRYGVKRNRRIAVRRAAALDLGLHPTAICRSVTCSSTADEITGVIHWSEAAQGGRALRPRDLDPRAPGAPGRRRGRVRGRRGPRRDPGVVVAPAQPAGGPLADSSTASTRTRPAASSTCSRSAG